MKMSPEDIEAIQHVMSEQVNPMVDLPTEPAPAIPTESSSPTPDLYIMAQQIEWLCNQMMFIRQLVDGIMTAASSNPMARAMLARMNGGK